jgi:hypothetical protein
MKKMIGSCRNTPRCGTAFCGAAFDGSALGGTGWAKVAPGTGACASATDAPAAAATGNAITVSSRTRKRLIDPIAVRRFWMQRDTPQSRKVVAEPGQSRPGTPSILRAQSKETSSFRTLPV